MLRRSLIVAALFAVSSPLAAQDEYVWTSDRPDGETPLGVELARTLDAGAIQVTYKFTQMNSQSLYFATDSFTVGQVLGDAGYQVAPTALSEQRHTFTGAYGLNEDITLAVSLPFSVMEREHFTSTGQFFVTGVEALGDLTATAIYQVYRGGPFRMDASLGLVIPTGKARTWATTPFSGAGEEPLPYDMRPGGGKFAFTPGISGQVQNEVGSVGAQFRGRIYTDAGFSDLDFRYGDSYLANGWAAYRVNDMLSLSAGIRWQIWGNVEGADPILNNTRDPVTEPVGLAGQRADMPVGINFVIPGDGPLAGHRILAEAVYALHHDYEGLQLGLDWGINLGYRMDF